MLSTFSSNVVLAKARAMYGRRLVRQNYQELLACHSVNEVASYLKSRTAYSKILSGINEADIHRGQLEVLLRQKAFEDSAALCRYEISVGEHFSQYILEKAEVEQIMHSLIHLMAGSPEEYLFSMPSYLNRHSHIDLLALGRIRSFDDLLGALRHTPYYKIVSKFRPLPEQPIDYLSIESALHHYLLSHCFSIIKNETHGETRRQLEEMFGIYTDIENFTTILRLKFNYHCGPDFIRSTLLPYGMLKERHIEMILDADTPADARAAFEKSPTGRKFRNLDVSADLLSTQAEYTVYRQKIRFSTHPCVVMLSYIFLMQIELHDITNIIEGIRYQVPSDDIASLLTIINFP